MSDANDVVDQCHRDSLKVAERAKRHPEREILALAHLIDEPALERAFRSPAQGRGSRASTASRSSSTARRLAANSAERCEHG